MRMLGAAVVLVVVWSAATAWRAGVAHAAPQAAAAALDEALVAALAEAGFTGRIESTLETRLGRPVDRELADLGRLVFFDESRDCTTTIPARAATHPHSRSATRSRLRSASRTTASSARGRSSFPAAR